MAKSILEKGQDGMLSGKPSHQQQQLDARVKAAVLSQYRNMQDDEEEEE